MEKTFTAPGEHSVNPRKWTTKVNIAMVVAVVVFVILAGGYLWWAASHPAEVRQQEKEQVEKP